MNRLLINLAMSSTLLLSPVRLHLEKVVTDSHNRFDDHRLRRQGVDCLGSLFRLYGRITKRGTKLGRTALVQCASIAQRYSRYLKNYYEKTKSFRGSGKAIIALARKFLAIVYRTPKNKWVFADSPKFLLGEEATMNFRIAASAHQAFAPAPAALWSLSSRQKPRNHK